MGNHNNDNLVPVLFRGKTKYLKPETINWVREVITDPNETLEQAIERLYVEGIQEQMEEEGTPSTLDYYLIIPV